jgi:hypothetical protein
MGCGANAGLYVLMGCPLWVISGHCPYAPECPLYPRERTSQSIAHMSAKCHKQTSASLFDHLVGS